MTKADIVEKIHTNTGMTQKESAEMVEAVFSIMKSTLETGETLKISGFGSFVVKQKNDRRGRNPQTGEAITIEARRILTFKPSTVLRCNQQVEIAVSARMWTHEVRNSYTFADETDCRTDITEEIRPAVVGAQSSERMGLADESQEGCL